MYTVSILPKAQKQLELLPRHYQESIGASIDVIAKDPFVGKKLEGTFRGTWTFRVWPYRIIYVFHRETVTVLRVVHRQGVYRK